MYASGGKQVPFCISVFMCFCLYYFVDFTAGLWFLVFSFLLWGKDKN
jgi:hypothetical protein